MHEQIPFEIEGKKGFLQRADKWWPPAAWSIYLGNFFFGTLIYQQQHWHLEGNFAPFKSELAARIQLWVDSHEADGSEYDLNKNPFVIDTGTWKLWKERDELPKWWWEME